MVIIKFCEQEEIIALAISDVMFFKIIENTGNMEVNQ